MLSKSLQLIELDSIDSTNTWALERCRSSNSGLPFVVVAHHQTRGQGRMGRVWQSQSGKTLCFSLAVASEKNFPGWVGLAVGVQIHQYLKALGVSDLTIKWPNDLLLKGAKLCGVLCQTSHASRRHCLVIGVGLNLKPLPEAKCQMAALSECGLQVSGAAPVRLAYEISQRLCNMIEQFKGELVFTKKDYFNQYDAYFGRQVRLLQNGEPIAVGQGQGVSDQGGYCVQMGSGIHTFFNVDLSLRALNDA